MSDASNDKIMGFIPKNKYVQITYWLLLVSAAGGTLTTVLALIGILLPLSGIFALCGLAALVLGLLGFFVFKEEFSSLDQSHLVYMAVLFAVFFVVGIIVGSALVFSPFVMYLVVVVLNLVQLLLVWTGYNSWKHGRSITKDNIKSEVQLALSRS